MDSLLDLMSLLIFNYGYVEMRKKAVILFENKGFSALPPLPLPHTHYIDMI